MASSQHTFEKLQGRENYHDWAFSVKNLFIIEGLWDSVLGTETVAKINEKAKAKLGLLVESTNFVHIEEAVTTKVAWNNLKKLYEDSGLYRKVSLLKTLLTVSLENSNSVEKYVNTVISTAHKLSSTGMNVSEEWIGVILLAGLSDDYRPMIMGIESSGQAITGDFVKIKLLQEIKNKDFQSAAAFQANKNEKSDDKKSVNCYECGKPGHLSKNCYRNRKKKSNNGKKSEKTVKKGLYTSFTAQEYSSENDWFVDSGASGHFTNNKDWMINVKKIRESIIVADNSKLIAEAKGDVRVKNMVNGKEEDLMIRNVLYVPGICANLLSVVQITSNGNQIYFSEKGCEISDKATGELIATATRKQSLYKLDVKKYGAYVCGQDVWHRRAGHCNDEILFKMKDGAVTGVNFLKNKSKEFCEICVEGKQAKLPFKTSSSSSAEILEIIHSDLCGPVEKTSLGGSKYFVTFLDDFSGRLFVYFLKTKDECFRKFVEFKTMIEKKTEKSIKTLRTDNGTEYCNAEFKNYLKTCGIVHETSAPYSPQQNGKAERINRTIVEKARCLLFDAGMSKEFWAEAVSTAAHIYNRTSSRVSEDFKSPEEMFSKKKPNLKYMRIFGSTAMVHIPKEKRKKFDPKSVKHVFVGYCENSKAYRLYNVKKRCFSISRDVVFNEAESYFRGQDLATQNIKNYCFFPLFDQSTEVQEPVIEVNAPVNEILDDAEDGSESFFSGEEDEVVDVSTIPPRQLRWSERIANKNPCLLAKGNNDPLTYDEAIQSADAEFWKEAIQKEYDSMLKNGTWETSDLPAGRKPLNLKWVFKKKYLQSGELDKYKARLVAKGYHQKPGIDYDETFSPVVRYETVRFLIAMATKYDLEIFQMDAVTAFLQGELTEEIYINQPEGFHQIKGKVLKLKKSIYGLKQSSRVWNKKLDNVFKKMGLNQSKADSCLYYKIIGGKMFLLTVYVDDLIIFTNDLDFMESFKINLMSFFDMKDLGKASSFLGICLTRNKKTGTIAIDQEKYIKDMLKRFKMEDCNAVSTPMEMKCKLTKPDIEDAIEVPFQELIGSLLFLARVTRPDILYAVNYLSKFNNCHGQEQWVAAKRILRYLKGTIGKKIVYSRGSQNDVKITGFCDADFAGDPEDRRSTTGFVFLVSGGAVTWNTKKQPTIALSTTEAEYMALTTAVQETMWLNNLQKEIVPGAEKIILHVDNQSALQLAKNAVYHNRTKHIDVKHHFVREALEADLLELKYISTKNMTADIFTKPLARPIIEQHSRSMGVLDNNVSEGVLKNEKP